MPTSARRKGYEFAVNLRKIGISCRGDVGIAPYMQTGRATVKTGNAVLGQPAYNMVLYPPARCIASGTEARRARRSMVRRALNLSFFRAGSFRCSLRAQLAANCLYVSEKHRYPSCLDLYLVYHIRRTFASRLRFFYVFYDRRRPFLWHLRKLSRRRLTLTAKRAKVQEDQCDDEDK